MEYLKILKVATLASKIILESGGEIYRVEQTAGFVCNAFGAAGCECYATPTVLILSLKGTEGQIYTNMERITSRTTDLNKVNEINRFSRSLRDSLPTLQEAEEQLLQIQKQRTYSLPVVMAASAVIAGSFCVAYGGSFRDLACGLAAGTLVRLLITILSRIGINSFFINMAGGMACAVLGWFFVLLGAGENQSIITISTLMLLVPGLLITNAIRDIAAGDLVSGTNRSFEAFFIAVAISSGAGFAYSLLLQIGGGL